MKNITDPDPEFDIFMEIYTDKEAEDELAFEDLAELMEAYDDD